VDIASGEVVDLDGKVRDRLTLIAGSVRECNIGNDFPPFFQFISVHPSDFQGARNGLLGFHLRS
jgi:hypothetical protein